MGKTYRSGIRSTSKQSPLAPTVGPATSGPPQGIYQGAVPPDRGTLRPKGSTATGGASGQGGIRPHVYERHGARHRIDVALPGPTLPEAQNTMMNAKIIHSYPKVRGDFYGDVTNW